MPLKIRLAVAFKRREWSRSVARDKSYHRRVSIGEVRIDRIVAFPREFRHKSGLITMVGIN